MSADPTGDAPLNAVVTHREDLGEALAVLRVAPKSGPAPAFEPGQHIGVGMPERDEATGAESFAVRPYSIASAATARDHLEFYVNLHDAMKKTRRLWPAPGGELHLADRAQGGLTLAGVPAGRDLVMFATGTGLAPFMAMLRTYGGASGDGGHKRWRRAVLVHGVRQVGDLGYRGELEAAARGGDFFYLPVVSQDGAGAWQGARGRLQQVISDGTYERLVGAALSPERCHVMLCGNPAMVDEVAILLLARGFSEGDKDTPRTLQFEKYW